MFTKYYIDVFGCSSLDILRRCSYKSAEYNMIIYITKTGGSEFVNLLLFFVFVVYIFYFLVMFLIDPLHYIYTTYNNNNILSPTPRADSAVEYINCDHPVSIKTVRNIRTAAVVIMTREREDKTF